MSPRFKILDIRIICTIWYRIRKLFPLVMCRYTLQRKCLSWKCFILPSSFFQADSTRDVQRVDRVMKDSWQTCSLQLIIMHLQQRLALDHCCNILPSLTIFSSTKSCNRARWIAFILFTLFVIVIPVNMWPTCRVGKWALMRSSFFNGPVVWYILRVLFLL